jgi:hypothetical protein
MRKITMTLAAAVFVLAERNLHSQDGLRRLGPLSSRPALGLRSRSLLVRSLLS